jgi:hypothetical protein
MPLYRTMERLLGEDGTVYEIDLVTPLKGIRPKVIAVLLEKKRIVVVQTPPLLGLRGWEERAAVLEPLGIEDVSQLVTADLDEVAEELDTSVETLRKAAQDAQSWLSIESEED